MNFGKRGVMLVLGLGIAFAAEGNDAVHSVKILTPETALKAAQAALRSCRERGFQATVAVVDRMGVLQVLLRDRFAGPHTTDMATAKAYTAVSFRTCGSVTRPCTTRSPSWSASS